MPGGKASKVLKTAKQESLDTLRNQQVMCSSHTTSSKKHRKLRLSVLFCCKAPGMEGEYRRFRPYCSAAGLYLGAAAGGAIPEMKDGRPI